MSVSTQFHGNGGSNVNRYQAGGLSAGLGGMDFNSKVQTQLIHSL